MSRETVMSLTDGDDGGPAADRRAAGPAIRSARGDAADGRKKRAAAIANQAMSKRTSHRGGPALHPGRVARWRRRWLERAGFHPALADALAGDRRTDVHALLELVDRGCPPELAARILAPLDGDEEPAG
jgi:hypothetical protein